MNKIAGLREKFKRGELIHGVHASIGYPMIMEIFCMAGFDAVWIDMEHTAINTQEVLLSVIAAGSYKTAVVVRIPWNDPILVKPVLEMGVDGIVFPMIRSAEEARKAIASCLYPPEGNRGFGPIRAVDYGFADTEKYVRDKHKNDMWKIIQIEHIDAVRDMDNILAVPGIDAMVIGPMDLSASLGCLPDYTQPTVKEALYTIRDKVKAAGIPLAISYGYNTIDKTGMEFFVDELNVDIAFAGSDVSFLVDGAKATLTGVNRKKT
jgi:2-dehydro-3-deoxyglucarate aldolase/4-hydroxy-2-oxoheptanedioate aldolase